MRTAIAPTTFEPKGISRLIREAKGRKEHRLKTPQRGLMEKLVLEVLGERRAAWRLHYDLVRGKVRTRRKLKIGDASTPLPAIRDRWLAALKAIEAGNDPAGEQATERALDAERSEMTLARLAGEYLSAKEKAGARSAGEMRRILEKDVLPWLGKRPVADLTALDVETITERIANRGAPVAARAAYKVMQGACNWALGTARWRAAGLTANPAAQIKAPSAPAAKTRKLTDQELRAFWAALDRGTGLEPGTADAFRLTLLLARRSKEVLQASWAEFELDRPDPLWRLPPARSKNKREVLIPLSAPAIAILRGRKAKNEAPGKFGDDQPSAYVFRGLGGEDRPATEGVLRTALRRMFDANTLSPPPFSVHDLRRTVAHRCAEELDFSREIIAAFLGQIAGNVTDMHYSQASKISRTRRLAEAWATHLEAILAGMSDSNVVALRSRA